MLTMAEAAAAMLMQQAVVPPDPRIFGSTCPPAAKNPVKFSMANILGERESPNSADGEAQPPCKKFCPESYSPTHGIFGQTACDSSGNGSISPKKLMDEFGNGKIFNRPKIL